MKKMKRVLTAVAAAALVVTAIPSVPAHAANVLAKYDFENGTGMTSTGFGTDPSVVNDAEMGNVLQFHDGGSSEYVTAQQDPDLAPVDGEQDTRVDSGTPSSLQFPNPFCGKDLSGMTIAMWVKVPAGAGSSGPGLVGFVSQEVTSVHPDKRDPLRNIDGDKDYLADSHGVYAYGITGSSVTGSSVELVPMINLAGLQHNWFTFVDDEATFENNADQWVHMIVSIEDAIDDTRVYINGEDIDGVGSGGKRYNHGESVDGTPDNTMEPTITEILTMAEMTTAYVGFTGFSPTSEGVCMDDLTFYDAAVSASEAKDLYTAAQAEVANKSGSGSQTSGGGDTTTDGDTAGGDTAGSGSTGGDSGSTTTTTSSGRTSGKTGSTTSTNLPQTGVVSTGVLVACGAAAVAGGAILFKKKEEE